MRRRILETEGEKDNSERWLLTYSDMITLLLALFIILYGMSSVDTMKLKEMSSGLEKVLNHTGQADSSAMGDNISVSADNLDNVYLALKAYIAERDLGNMIDVSSSGSAVSIHLKDAMLFKPDTAILLPDSKPVIQEISSSLEAIYGDINHITITGNTADLGHHDTANEADSWQLSVDRAVAVLNQMTAMGLEPSKMSIEGNSHYNPIATNDTEDGRAKNRRVEITITGRAN
ncbi:chemotaxis protein MotB [Lacrimispora sphenoides]|jgi:chemotaxis protein MotB|uniref:OmpA/MotB family protein n=1 Tax=Lacrimispora sphenoides TaxID=29370 RepID=UPI0008D11F40|nr:flagellar motor protein MotB [Lacrimispora sphenoides]SEU30706.1 chemotaxis protein MotB [Lacrimispora sphenoides]